MNNWYGAAGLCLNDRNELLMVLQGKSEERKSWSVPSGGVERNENFWECCQREVEEETGYLVKVEEEIKVKKGYFEDVDIHSEVHYFSVKIVGGERSIQDPDELIYDIAWKSVKEIKTLNLSFPEDRAFLINYIEMRVKE